MKAAKTVQRQNGIALWRQIADRIRQSISNGEHDVSMMLPPEKTLASTFDVNRHTVRSALAALASEGIVQPVQGSGTMIKRPRRLKLPISRRTRFSEGVGAQAAVATATLISQRREAAKPEVALALGISIGAACIVLDTVHAADAVPISSAANWFEAARFTGIADALMHTGSISAALAELGVTDYVRLSTEVCARHADANDIARLRLSPGAIVLEAVSVNATPDGTPIQYSVTCFAADRVSLQISL
jgi:GntR family transcriptional regulator, phosphonate transport system regulatory protein